MIDYPGRGVWTVGAHIAEAAEATPIVEPGDRVDELAKQVAMGVTHQALRLDQLHEQLLAHVERLEERLRR